MNTHICHNAAAPFDAAAFVSEFRELGGDLVVYDDPAQDGRRWFGVMNPPSGFNSPRAGEMRSALVASSAMEAAVIAAVAREERTAA